MSCNILYHVYRLIHLPVLLSTLIVCTSYCDLLAANSSCIACCLVTFSATSTYIMTFIILQTFDVSLWSYLYDTLSKLHITTLTTSIVFIFDGPDCTVLSSRSLLSKSDSLMPSAIIYNNILYTFNDIFQIFRNFLPHNTFIFTPLHLESNYIFMKSYDLIYTTYKSYCLQLYCSLDIRYIIFT